MRMRLLRSWRARRLHEYMVLQPLDFWESLKLIVKWTLLGGAAGVLAGTAAYLFLIALAWATATRLAYPNLLYALPLIGLGVGWLYHRFGGTAALGNTLVIDEVNNNRGKIPLRMAPFVLLGTILTHLGGGSAGREGTAIQMGASLADGLRRLLGLTGEDRRLLLMAGISGGFGSVFGVPAAGFVFGMEVQGIGRIRYEGIVPCLAASVIGDLVARAWGAPHSHYPHFDPIPLEPLLLLKVVLAGIAFGLTSLLFVELTHGIKLLMNRLSAWPPLYPVIGGVAVIGLTTLSGTQEYLGLSLPLITASVEGASVAPWAFALKLLFTAVTLGTGYVLKGSAILNTLSDWSSKLVASNVVRILSVDYTIRAVFSTYVVLQSPYQGASIPSASPVTVLRLADDIKVADYKVTLPGTHCATPGNETIVTTYDF
ncbi:MAG: chloride channel protein, partial [Caldilineaceae bacterium]